MLDNLRNQSGDKPIFIEEEAPKEESPADFLEVKPKPPKRRRTFDQITGTTALQRFILAVMLFSYAVRSVYIESVSMFVRGGVYRVVKEAMGGTLAKLSVSALLFDYVLTGPISGVSAGRPMESR